MTLRFAAARPAAPSIRLARVQVVRIAVRAANDNGDGENHGEILRAALKHFARFGQAAAAHARDQARTAHFAGNRAGYLHWLAVCRALDRRMAAALAGNLAKRPRQR